MVPIDRVSALLQEVAAEVLLPRFRHLADSEVTEKAPGELVTTADRAPEQLLTTRLTALLAGSMVGGEEGVAETPSLLDLLATGGPVWLVNPLDGTSNFAADHGPFGIMVALLQGGETVVAWLLDRLGGTCAVAEAGSGAFINEVRVRSVRDDPNPLHGAILTRFLPADLRTSIDRRSRRSCRLRLRGVRVPGDRSRGAALRPILAHAPVGPRAGRAVRHRSWRGGAAP
jgi:fructose-1,6-bisphosphatase/inositol monophosphatase family enzyme